MYKEKKVACVIPAFKEERQIAATLKSMPGYLDHLIVVDDCSPDKTSQITEEMRQQDARILLVRHEKNQGVGGAIASGYKKAIELDVDAAVVMAGDGQMDPSDLPQLLDPVVEDGVDYAKGNRLFTGEAYKKIPKVRYYGNAVLSMLTKIASGYWHVADSQTGYTVIGKHALNSIDWDKMYKRYGQPNDLLVRLNVLDMKVKDVPVKPVYNIGEKSGIQLRKVIFTIPFLLWRLFMWRMKEKYVIRNFHPLVFFYMLGFLFGLATLVLFGRLFYIWYETAHIPKVNALAAMFSFMSCSIFTLFAMWFDMESNKELKG